MGTLDWRGVNLGILFRKKDFTITEPGISKVEKIKIGGIDQYILIQSEDISNPVLLMIHGGPGLPIPGVSNRSKDYAVATSTKELIKHYTVVFWGQRGTGKSARNTPKDSFTIDQFVSDAKEVVQYLKSKFDHNKIYLSGYSWGTVLGLRLAYENPEDFHAYIGISQIVDWSENDALCLEWTLNKAREKNNQKAIQELTSCGQPPYIESTKQWGTLRKWMARYNSMVYSDHEVKHPGMRLGISIILSSPDYSIKDIMNTARGFQRCYTQRMIEDIAKLHFKKTIDKIEIPVIFIHGKKDVHLFGELVDQYYTALDAPAGKQLFWMEKSSHMFHPDDAREIEKILIQIVAENNDRDE